MFGEKNSLWRKKFAFRKTVCSVCGKVFALKTKEVCMVGTKKRWMTALLVLVLAVCLSALCWFVLPAKTINAADGSGSETTTEQPTAGEDFTGKVVGAVEHGVSNAVVGW